MLVIWQLYFATSLKLPKAVNDKLMFQKFNGFFFFYRKRPRRTQDELDPDERRKRFLERNRWVDIDDDIMITL